MEKIKSKELVLASQQKRKSPGRFVITEQHFVIPEGALEKVSERTVAEISTGTRDEVVVNVSPGVDVVEQVPTGVVLKEETYIVKKPLKNALPNGNKA